MTLKLSPAALHKLEIAKLSEAIAKKRMLGETPEFRGAAKELMTNEDEEYFIVGPAGTGKTFACLYKIHYNLSTYPGARALIVRKIRSSLNESGLRTFEDNILGKGHPLLASGRERAYRQKYKYPNGSEFVVTGMDNPDIQLKVMSSEYDIIYCLEAVELAIGAIEDLNSRLRNFVLPYQQLILDANPGPPRHPLKQRAELGLTTMRDSFHVDNPRLFMNGKWTEKGALYLKRLSKLTGHRRLRLFEGRWARAEGLVYETYDQNIHLIDSFDVPGDWRRILVIDFGYKNPFVAGDWALDHDDNAYLVNEIYMTRRTVDEHVKGDLEQGWESMLEWMPPKRFEAVICDHDLEDRATLERLGYNNIAAYKAVEVGIQAVIGGLKIKDNGKPSIFFFKDALIERDESLVDAGKPFTTSQEFDSYMWAKDVDGKERKEKPVKNNDHGSDMTRYMKAYVNDLDEAAAGDVSSGEHPLKDFR